VEATLDQIFKLYKVKYILQNRANHIILLKILYLSYSMALVIINERVRILFMVILIKFKNADF
jgi:hypothetical protein